MSQIIRDITEIARCGAQYRTEALAPMGLKACHASYLTEICAHPGISQDKLAARICINKSNVARQAAILEEDLNMVEGGKRALRAAKTKTQESLDNLLAEYNEMVGYVPPVIEDTKPETKVESEDESN